MAVDTVRRRFSMLNFGHYAVPSVLPVADGTIASTDMQTLLGLYEGIALDAPPDVSAVKHIVGSLVNVGTLLLRR